MHTSAILGVGYALGSDRVTSADTEQNLHLPAGWIESRTGIVERPLASPTQATSDLATAAGAEALRGALVDPQDVGLVLLATSTPDYPLPPTAPQVADRLGCHHAGALDVAGACAGFLYALALADAHHRVRGGYVLVVAANVLSRRVNRQDRATATVFSDGAGAVLLGTGAPHQGLAAVYLGAEGHEWDAIWIPAGGSREPLTAQGLGENRHLMHMPHGPRLFKAAVRHMTRAGQQVLNEAHCTAQDVDWWIPHQANRRITVEVGRQLDIPSERTIDVISHYGNSSSATIPIALANAVTRRQIQPGHTLLFTAIGSGITSAGILWRW